MSADRGTQPAPDPASGSDPATGPGADPDPATGPGADPDRATGPGADPDRATGPGADPDRATGPGPGPDPAADCATGPSAPADPRKAFRGPASACLSLQVIILPLALPVMSKVEGGLSPVKIAWVVVLTLGMIVAIATFSRPWGLPLAIGLQVATVLGWLVSPALGALGLVFALVWALMLWMRAEVLRRQAAWAAGGPPARAE